MIAIDYVYRYFAFEPYNQSPLNIETPEGNAQPYHPSVVYIPGGWNGYAYWMAETPYPLGPDGDWNGLPPYRARWENPCIHASHDGIHWETPGDLVNPIDDLNETEIENRDFFSDTHLVMNGDTLECWYRISRTQRDETYILRKYSADGIHWSERETVIDLQDPAVVREGPGGMIVSPAIQKDRRPVLHVVCQRYRGIPEHLPFVLGRWQKLAEKSIAGCRTPPSSLGTSTYNGSTASITW